MKKAIINGSKIKYLYSRNGKFIYRRVIPASLRNLSRGLSEFKESLHTDVPNIALTRYAEIHAHYDTIMGDMRHGIPYDPKKPIPLDKLKDIAKSVQIDYKPATKLTDENNPAEFAARYAKWEALGKPEGPQFDAIFGAQEDPITLSGALEFYIDHIRDELISLDKRSKDKKLNPKKAAIRSLTEFFGEDANVEKLTKNHALSYRTHLLDRIENGEIVGASANKQFSHIRSVLNVNINQRDLNITNPFSGISVKEEKGSRPPYSTEFLRKNWFDGNPFEELNDEAKNLLFAMIDTGCGHKELCGLDPETDIKLDHDVPHIIVQANEHRKLKTDHRGRTIPLVGKSLEAMKACPNGFPRYRRENGSEAASALIMKFLRTNTLLESPKHGVYSLRHTFKDRMRIHKFPQELQNYLMGHRDPTMGAHYGSGYSLKDTQDYMLKLEWDWGS